MKEAKDQSTNHFKPLTIERLRQFEGLRTLSNEEAKRVIESLDQLEALDFYDKTNGL
jgi:hypothetical protein